MRAMTEIEWLDGRVTKVPELALGDALGESVQAELDFGFDDVLEGLWVEVRHHEPDEDSDGDPRGRGCALYADCRYSLVDGFPVYGKTIALIYMCIPGSGICFSLHRHRATSVAYYTATRLHAYGATRRRPAERRKGRPWASSGHAPIFERAAVGASRNPSASAGLFSKSGGAAENPRVEPRGLIHNRADALCNRKKEGHGRPRSRKPVPHLRHRDDRVEYI